MKKRTHSFIILLAIPLLLIGMVAMTNWLKTEDAIIEKANAFLASLTEDQKNEVVFQFDDSTRTIWHFMPVASFDRSGLAFAELTDQQDEKVLELLRASLSVEGFNKAESIVDLENVLKVLEKDNATRDPEQYHIAIYGTPAMQGTWGYSFSGHHLSLHYTFVDGKLSTSPTFLGSNPAEVPSGPKKGLRVLKDEEDLGLELINALSSDQQALALITKIAPREIFTANAEEVAPLEEIGVAYGDISAASQEMFDALILEYISVMPADVAQSRLTKLVKAGKNDIRFAWAGPMDRSAGHYYRIQGPTFLVEFDNTQNNANHIHSVWRDFSGDFGRDVIRAHYHSADGKHGHD